MSKLNAIIAVESGVKSKASRALTDLYRTLKKPAVWSGLSRTYSPKDEDGERFPAESTLVQVTAKDALDAAVETQIRLYDVVYTKERGNTVAKADVVVDGNTLLSNVPVTYLLFLEKAFKDFHAFLTDLPVLDPAVSWSYDEQKGFYVSEPTKTVKTKKIPRVLVKAKATDKHPEQTEVYYEDVSVGEWTKTDFSGAISATHKRALLDRLEKVQRAVKVAREEANSVEVEDYNVAEDLFNWLLS